MQGMQGDDHHSPQEQRKPPLALLALLAIAPLSRNYPSAQDWGETVRVRLCDTLPRRRMSASPDEKSVGGKAEREESASMAERRECVDGPVKQLRVQSYSSSATALPLELL